MEICLPCQSFLDSLAICFLLSFFAVVSCLKVVSLYLLLGISIFDLLNEILESMKQDEGSPFIAALTNDIHILPDFHGNRYSVLEWLISFLP